MNGKVLPIPTKKVIKALESLGFVRICQRKSSLYAAPWWSHDHHTCPHRQRYRKRRVKLVNYPDPEGSGLPASDQIVW